MGYEVSKDVVVAGPVNVLFGGKTWLQVELRSYEGSKNKVVVTRCAKSEEGNTVMFRSGRLTVEETRAVADAAEKMQVALNAPEDKEE
jgi:hypothetical protein